LFASGAERVEVTLYEQKIATYEKFSDKAQLIGTIPIRETSYKCINC